MKSARCSDQTVYAVHIIYYAPLARMCLYLCVSDETLMTIIIRSHSLAMGTSTSTMNHPFLFPSFSHTHAMRFVFMYILMILTKNKNFLCNKEQRHWENLAASQCSR